jgi:hypothetical protein
MDFERELLILELEEEWQEYQQEQEKYYNSKPRWYQIVIGHILPSSKSEMQEAFGLFCSHAGIRKPVHIFGSDGVRDLVIKCQGLKTF